MRPSLYEDSGGNPFYLEQLARSARPSRRAGAGRRDFARGRRRPGCGRRRARRGARAALRAGTPRPRGRRRRGRSLRSRAGRRGRRSRRGGGDRRDRRAAAAGSRPPDRRSAPVPLPAPARPPRGVRVDARRLAARRARALRRGARPPRLAGRARSPTTSNAPHVRATRPRSRYCERLARRRPRVHRRAPHAGSPRPSVSSRRLRRATGASSCCSPVPKRSPPPANSARAMQRSSRASNIVPQEAESLRVRLTAACARVEHLLGRYKEAHAHLETALAELRDPDSAQGVELMIELAGDSLYHGDYDAMRAWAGRAVDAAELLGDRALIAAALAVRALASAVGGRAAEGQEYCAEAAALIDGLADDELGSRLDALAHLATAEFYLDRFTAAGLTPSARCESVARPGRAISSRSSSPCSEAACGFGAGWRSRARCSTARSQPRGSSDNPQGLAWNLFNRSYAAFAAGDIDLALATAKEAFDLAQAARPRSHPCARGSGAGLRAVRDRSSGAVRRAARGVRRRKRAAADRRRLAGAVPRASDPLSPRGGPPRRSRARRGGCAGVRRGRWPPDGGRDGSPRRRGARSRRRRAGGRRRASAGRCSGTRGRR